MIRMIGLFVVAWSALLCAQDDGRNDRIQQLSVLSAPTAEYQLGIGDLIGIGVFGVGEYSHEVRINADGTIRLPLLEPVAAGGLTAAALEAKLESLLDGRGVIRNPDVSVNVKEHRSQTVFLLGAVIRPGEYQMTRPLKLIDLLAMAGGVKSDAANTLTIQRQPQGSVSGQAEFVRVDLKALLESGDPR